MFSKISLFSWAVCTLLLYARIVECEQKINPASRDTCARSLLSMVIQICFESFEDNALSSASLSGKKASMFMTAERLDQIANECCSVHPCSMVQLFQYCPENW
uniref:Insulin-like peptide transcript variant X14 n=1 Tax=Galleria mellonella TaxID=7137 RepID=A0AA50IE33_GALME|nr:insulin-like peptide transcript variant X14 [Galleria mellonella]